MAGFFYRHDFIILTYNTSFVTKCEFILSYGVVPSTTFAGLAQFHQV